MLSHDLAKEIIYSAAAAIYSECKSSRRFQDASLPHGSPLPKTPGWICLTMAVELSHSAPRACHQCKHGKRRCDKVVPSCTRCSRYNLKCQYNGIYEEPIERIDTIRRRLARLERSFDASHRYNPLAVDYAKATPLLYGRTTSKLEEVNLWQSFLATPLDWKTADQTLYGLVSNLINASGSSVLSTCEAYFRTVQKWLPVISKHRVYHMVTSPQQKPQADFALLILSIHLMTLLPSDDSEQKRTQESAYLATKCIQAQLLSFIPISLEVVQSCLLIAIYEYARGNFQSAYLSMGTCMRAVSTLGLPEKGQQCSTTDRNSWSKAEENHSLWWGCVMLDRLVLQLGVILLLAGTLSVVGRGVLYD
ncbi:fungal-specific transcription factor domain-containing protein [Xylogone sp. PMI_703]|nr:fungal-specific transcription factor domain-containing protein [Xylogone sp. PMI_703]